MSFDKLKASSYEKKCEDIEIVVKNEDATDVVLKFQAKEISYLQRLKLAEIQHKGNEAFTHLIVFSIVDEKGKHMTFEQAESLSPEYQEKFFLAAARVNAVDEEKKT